MENEKLFELLIEEVRTLRQESRDTHNRLFDEMKSMRNDFDTKMDGTSKDINSLKTRFMIVAISMGMAGGKVSAMLPFLK